MKPDEHHGAEQFIVVRWGNGPKSTPLAGKKQWNYPLSYSERTGHWYLRIFSKREIAEAFIKAELAKDEREPAEHYKIASFHKPPPLEEPLV